MRVYVASSWRNRHQPEVVRVLREHGHDVYDFRHPELGDDGFHWSEIDGEWRSWDSIRFREGLKHELAEKGFAKDMNALKSADAVVLVQPCGISAHLELGWAAGAGKKTVVLLEGGEPELMYKMCGHMCVGLDEVVASLHDIETRLYFKKRMEATFGRGG